MSEASETAVAQALRAAYRDGPIDPLGLRPGDLASAYRVQDLNTRHWARTRGGIVGRKIGLTSQAVQRQFGVDQPDYGILFADMAVTSGGHIEPGQLLQPRIESEIAICIGTDLRDVRVTADDLVAATEWMSAALEIVDSRVRDWRIGIVDTIADNASSGLFVIGAERVSVGSVDAASCVMELRAEGRVVSSGTGAATMGSPFIAAAWLARKMIEVGRPLCKGDLVMTGALGPMIPMARGSQYEAEIQGLGRVAVSYGS